MRILIVEDEIAFADALQFILINKKCFSDMA